MFNINKFYQKNFRIGDSNIHGVGLIANRDLKKNQIIGIAIYYSLYCKPTVTNSFGKWVNHSYSANSYLYFEPKKNIYFLVANKDIFKNEEITANYNYTPWFIKKPESHYK